MHYIAVVDWNHARVQHPRHLVYIALSQSDIKPLFHLAFLRSFPLRLLLDQYSSVIVGHFLYSFEGLDDIGNVVEWRFSLFVNRGFYSIGT